MAMPILEQVDKLADNFAVRRGDVEHGRIDVAAADVLTVVTGEGSEVTFGLRDFERQLRRWREIRDVGYRLGRCIATVDLSVTHNIPVRWLEPGQAPPQNPTPVKPNRHRRKNVR